MKQKGAPEFVIRKVMEKAQDGYGGVLQCWLTGVWWVWVNTYRYIFSGMNIHLPAILGFTRYQGFDPSPGVNQFCFPKGTLDFTSDTSASQLKGFFACLLVFSGVGSGILVITTARLAKTIWLHGSGSKPWYLVNPKIAGKWMFIPLKMYL